MTRIAEFTQDNRNQLEEELLQAATGIAGKYGLQLSARESSLSPDGATLASHLQFSLPVREESVATRKEEEDYLSYAESFGVRPGWLGKEFVRGNFTYRVVGLRVGEPKECIVLQRSDGARSCEEGKLVRKHLG